EEKKAFISRLYESLCRHDYNIRIDTKDIGYTNLISEFIRQLADSECIIVVISDKYLCSPYCMIELLEIQRNHNIQRRVLPIVYEDVDIGSAGGRMGYLEYWHGQVEQVNEYIKSTGLLPLLGGQTLRDLENFRDIENSFDRLLSFILDMNFRLPSEIEESDFLLLRTRLDEECI
ncbi:MAG: toll/interleukin-1 receptor domain-containing protein, partial [Candidatus Thiodiazotropha sp.]